MIPTLLQIFFVSFLLNLLYEVAHSPLYATCLKAPLKKYVPLIIGASLKDGFFITCFFLASVLPFENRFILDNSYQASLFVFLALAFSYADERVSLKMKRWEYSEQMPLVLGVGITPLLELAVTGLVTFAYVFWT
jgi:hypothetical protein